MTVPTKKQLLLGTKAQSSSHGYIHVTDDGLFLHEPCARGLDRAELVRETTDHLLSAYVTPRLNIPKMSIDFGVFNPPKTTAVRVKVCHQIEVISEQ